MNSYQMTMKWNGPCKVSTGDIRPREAQVNQTKEEKKCERDEISTFLEKEMWKDQRHDSQKLQVSENRSDGDEVGDCSTAQGHSDKKTCSKFLDQK